MAISTRLRIVAIAALGFAIHPALTQAQFRSASRSAPAPKQSPKNSAEMAKLMGVETLSKGTSSRAEKKRAIDAIPFRQLNREQHQRVDGILRSISQFRRLPTLRTKVQPEVYQYFMAHPDVAVSLWRVMRISEFKMWQTGATQFEADAGDGSVGAAEILVSNNRECLAICNGVYKNPLLSKPIQAQALVHLQFQFQPGPAGQPVVVTQQISAFVSFPSTAVKTVAKVISPVTNMIMDRNFLEITVFLKVMSDSMERRPGWVKGMAKKMDGVLVVRKQELTDLTTLISGRLRQANVRAGYTKIPVLTTQKSISELRQMRQAGHQMSNQGGQRR